MRKILFTIALAVTAFALYANPEDGDGAKSKTGFDTKRLVYGGQVGFGVGSNDYWSIYLSPQIGYMLTDRLIVGTGISYAYAQRKYTYYVEYKEKQNQFGVNLFTDFYLTRRIFVTARPEIFYQNTKWNYLDVNGKRQKGNQNDFIPAVVLGAGISVGMATLSINYDIIQDDLTPYGDSVFLSIGIRF